MNFLARLVPETRRSRGERSARCTADWRRDGGYWRCTREAGHRGRHRMRAASRDAEDAASRDETPRSGHGGIAAG